MWILDLNLHIYVSNLESVQVRRLDRALEREQGRDLKGVKEYDTKEFTTNYWQLITSKKTTINQWITDLELSSLHLSHIYTIITEN